MWLKSMLISFCLILLCMELILGENTNKKTKEQDEFVATNEWKQIKTDQAVPGGLYYRINLKTGKKEAKLLSESDTDNEDNKKKSVLVVENSEEQIDNNNIKPNVLEHSYLKDKLKKIKNDFTNIDQSSSFNKFRSYEQLKSDLESLNLLPKSDSELLKELFEKYKKESTKKNPDKKVILKILEDFIFLSHQFDNALDFIKLDGFNLIIYKNLNTTSASLKESSLRLFSSLVQNNAKVKIHALETGSLPILIRLLSNDISKQVQLRTVTALSCLLRMFPYAQTQFLENGGLSIISSAFKSEFINLKIKLATLMTDLLDERNKDSQNFENHKSIDLESELIKINWCESLNSLLKDLYVIDNKDHDALEKCLNSMQTVREKCHESYNKNLLFNMYESYKKMAKEDSDDADYFIGLSQLCENLAYIEEETKLRTEL